ncbi:MAG: hypothetical protein M3N37_03095 [Actinomycetota bacterium]|nr:hypothetical protein [Actinomycetota bacterium]
MVGVMARQAPARGASIAVLVREALDSRFPAVDSRRRAAAAAILEAEPMTSRPIPMN